jgi:hypothetical protein
MSTKRSIRTSVLSASPRRIVKVARADLVLRPALHLERVVARPQVRARNAGDDEMVVPIDHARRLDRLAASVFQMHADRDRPSGLFVQHPDFQLRSQVPA